MDEDGKQCTSELLKIEVEIVQPQRNSWISQTKIDAEVVQEYYPGVFRVSYKPIYSGPRALTIKSVELNGTTLTRISGKTIDVGGIVSNIVM